jgi:cephalosporin-C deacetylase
MFADPHYETYLGLDPRPEDFDVFWSNQLTELSHLNVSYQLEPAAYQLPGRKCYDLYFHSFDSSRIHCKVAMPITETKLPVLFYFHGYKGNSLEWWHKIFWADQGYCVVAMDVRGQAGESQDLTSGFGSTSIGHLAAGINGTLEDMTFCKIYKDIICMVNLVRSFHFVDPNHLVVHGGSQGGALSLVTAALFPQVKKAAVMFPFLSDFHGVYRSGAAATAYEELKYIFRFYDPQHKQEEEFFRKLAYLDVKNFAPMIQAEVLMASGLQDQSCPAFSHFAVYNNLTCKKQLEVFPDFGHEDFLPGFTDQCSLFLARD